MDQVKPFIVSIWCGDSKPNNLNEYLCQFVNELNEILADGIIINGFLIKVGVRCFIADSPARSFIKGSCNFFFVIKYKLFCGFCTGTVNFNHTNGCQKCEVAGIYKKRMSFPDMNAVLRTDHSFRHRSQPAHHKERSLLESLPIDLIDDVIVADSLHLLEHGVTKNLLNMWKEGSTLFDFKFTKADIGVLNEKIFQANKEMPSDCHRTLRPITHMKYWKGTELRTFLLYVGVIVLRDILDFEAYDNFLQLFCAVRICYCEKYNGIRELAQTLFNEFVTNFALIYGSDHVVSNIHNLIHVYRDVERFGNLNMLSSYRFENALRHIKLQVQARGAPLDQIARRIVESTNNLKMEPINFDTSKWQPYLKYYLDQQGISIYRTYKYIQLSPNVYLSIKKPGDSFFFDKRKTNC